MPRRTTLATRDGCAHATASRQTGDRGAASREVAEEESPLMTAREVAALFRRTGRSIRNWTKSGRLKPIRIGRALYFRRSDIEQLLTGAALPKSSLNRSPAR